MPIWLGSRLLGVDGRRASDRDRPGDDWETAESRSQDVAEVDLIGSVQYTKSLPRLEDKYESDRFLSVFPICLWIGSSPELSSTLYHRSDDLDEYYHQEPLVIKP